MNYSNVNVSHSVFGWFSYLCVLCVLCGYASGQEWKTAHDGVEYAQVNLKLGTEPVKINLLRLDLTKVRLDVHHAMDAAIGTEKTSSIATRHKAVAAINAGFFRLDSSLWAGDSAGVLKIDHKFLSESKDFRIVITILNGALLTNVEFGHPDTQSSVSDKKFTGMIANGVNRQRNRDEMIIYTPDFGRSTLTEPDGVEFIVQKGRVAAISYKGSNSIPHDGFVLSGVGDGADGLLDRWRLGSRLRFSNSLVFTPYDFQPDIDRETKRIERLLMMNAATFFKSEDVTNGVPQLIKNGKIDITWEQEKALKSFVETRHPRTAVAKMKDGKFLMITVDGRQPSVSVGMNLQELAEYLLSLGAVDAMNLDGGGSTTMFLDGKVINAPSDKEGERKIGDAILVTLRKPKT